MHWGEISNSGIEFIIIKCGYGYNFEWYENK